MLVRLHHQRQQQGFTLIELLLVISIIAILAAIVILAVNPQKQLGDARNAQRFSDVNSVLNAFWQYAMDHNGVWQPPEIDGSSLASGCQIGLAAKKLCKVTTPNGTGIGECGDTSAGGANQCVFTRHLSGTYVTNLASDPADDESTVTEQLRLDYTISLATVTTRLRVEAPNADLGATIAVTR